MIRRPLRSTLFPYTTLFRPPPRRSRRSTTPRLAVQSHRPSRDRKSTRLNSSHVAISYAVFCLKKKTTPTCKTRTEHQQNLTYIKADSVRINFKFGQEKHLYDLPVAIFAFFQFFFFNDTATTEIYTLSLHDALPIPIPGPNAAVTALSAAGIADGPFLFI